MPTISSVTANWIPKAGEPRVTWQAQPLKAAFTNTHIKARYLYCPVRCLQTGAYGCDMASFSFCSGNPHLRRFFPCSVSRGWMYASILTSPHERLFSMAKQVTQQIVKADWIFTQPCSDFSSPED